MLSTVQCIRAQSFYYEGRLSGTVMPWSIAISYYLDGVQHNAQEIAGASDALRISISIQRNENDAGNFFEGYALQGIVTLDTLRADNIRSNGPTIANVGRSKQLTYTILLGKGAQIEITADVTDFQMEGIYFNGIPMEMDLTVDYDELLIQVPTRILNCTFPVSIKIRDVRAFDVGEYCTFCKVKLFV